MHEFMKRVLCFLLFEGFSSFFAKSTLFPAYQNSICAETDGKISKNDFFVIPNLKNFPVSILFFFLFLTSQAIISRSKNSGFSGVSPLFRGFFDNINVRIFKSVNQYEINKEPGGIELAFFCEVIIWKGFSVLFFVKPEQHVAWVVPAHRRIRRL